MGCVVTRLANGTAYTFRVIATNTEGNGVAGVSSGAVVPTAASASGSVAAAATIPAVSGLRAVLVDAGSVRLAFTTGKPGARHAATCSTQGGKTGRGSGTTSPVLVKGLSYGKSYVCDVVSSLSGVSSTIASVRVAVLADLPKPTGVTAGSRARSGSTISVAWAVPSVDSWVRIVQRVELKSGVGRVLAKAFARSRASRASAVLSVPATVASGSYSVCVVFEDSRAPANEEQVCRRAQVSRPSTGGTGGASSGGSQASKPIGPIVL